MYLRCPECKTRYEISAARIPDGGARVRCPRCRTVFHVSRPLNGNGAEPFDEEVAEAGNGSGHGAGLAADVAPPRAAVADADPPAETGEAAPYPAPGYALPPAAINDTSPRVPGGDLDASRPAPGDTEPRSTTGGAFATAGERAPEPAAGGRASASIEYSHRMTPDADPATDAAPVPVRRPIARPVVPGAAVDSATARRIARAVVSDLASARREQRDGARRSGRVLSALGPVIAEAWDDYRRRVGDAMAQDTPHFRDALTEFLGDGEPLL